MFNFKKKAKSSQHEDFGNVELYYSQFYPKIIGNQSKRVMRLLSSYPHKLIEKNKDNRGLKILEIGAGEGEHTKYVKSGFIEYLLTDVDQKRLSKAQANLDSGIFTSQMSAEKLDLEDSSFDRIIVTCVLAHLKFPEEALNEWNRVLKPGGNLSVYIPCEPGIGLRLFRYFISKRKAENMGFKGYSLFIARDHINSASNLRTIISHVYRDAEVRVKYRPFPIPTWYFNLFQVIEISK